MISFMERIFLLARRIVRLLAMKILVYVVGALILTAISFLFTKNFTVNAYSDRMVWVGLFLFLLSVVVWLGIFFAGRPYNVPALIKRPDEAKRYLVNREAIQVIIERRYSVAIQVWLIGFTCILFGALIQILWGES